LTEDARLTDIEMLCISGERCGRYQRRIFVTVHYAWAKTRQVDWL